MNNHKELIEQLKHYGLTNGSSLGRHMGIMDEAADALVALTEKNAQLLDKLKSAQESHAFWMEEEMGVQKQLRAETEQLKDTKDVAIFLNLEYLKELEQVKRERDAAVAHLRTYQVFVNSCAFCKHDHDCDKQGPGRKSVEECWEWHGPQP